MENAAARKQEVEVLQKNLSVEQHEVTKRKDTI